MGGGPLGVLNLHSETLCFEITGKLCVCVCVSETRLPPDPGCSVFHLQVQFQKIQQLRLSQSRASYYGGSLPNVNQIGKANTEFQVGLRGGLRPKGSKPPDTFAPG